MCVCEKEKVTVAMEEEEGWKKFPALGDIPLHVWRETSVAEPKLRVLFDLGQPKAYGWEEAEGGI